MQRLRPIGLPLFVGCFAFYCIAARAEDKSASREELGGFPLLGGDSDLGIGVGGFVSLARFDPGYAPYRYRLELAGAITFKPSHEGLEVPYQDIYLALTMPQLMSKRLRLELRGSYTHETTLAYSGIGNASPAPASSAARYFEYGLVHPTLLLRLRLHLVDRLYLQLGDILSYDRPQVRADSLLAADAATPALRDFFGTSAPHFVNVFEYTALYDSRDDETSTTRGMFHQLRLRLSPGGEPPFPYRYGQVDATLRFFQTWRPVTIALRVVGDALFGHPPFYELPRFDDTYAIGGVNGVRGVPAQRYYGKIKLFGNAEVRIATTDFHLFGLACKLQTVGFFDLGRLWSDYHRDRRLDGDGVGLKFGTGLGLRVQQGEAFVLRGDLAWSPDARPIGGYVTAGQLF